MHDEEIRYTSGGITMHGRSYWNQAENGPRPGVLVFPGASGLIEQTKEAAARLADAGYVTLACDYYGEGYGPGASDEELLALYESLKSDPLTLRSRAQAALAALAAHPEVDSSRIGAIGFCFGGATALELACAGAPLAVVIGFHTSVASVTLSDARNIVGRILICNGAEDPIAPSPEGAQFESAMRDASVRWQLIVYGGVVHAFTDPTGGRLRDPKLGRYDRWAAEDSWQAMRRLLNDELPVRP